MSSFRLSKLGITAWSLSNYGFPTAGLLCTYVALYLMNGQGQPALLYLVPCTLGMNCSSITRVVLLYLFLNFVCFGLGPIVLLGLARGELKELWNYSSYESPPTSVSEEA